MPAFAALPGLEELAIKELHHTYVTDCSVAEEVCQVLGRLRSLRLNIAHVHSRHPDDDYDEETVHTFFSSFASFWLMPTTANLEHLTLYSTLYFGFYPKCDITSVHFPRLKSLALGNYTFVSDDQLSWILSHGSTLRELYLDDCPILHQVAVYNIDNQTSRIQRTALPLELYKPHPQLDEKLLATYGTRWVDYLDAFNTGLPHLRHFRMGHGPSWWADGSPPFEQETSIEIGLSNAYMVFCDGMDQPFRDRMVYNIVDTGNEFGMGLMDGEVLEPSEEDKRALRELLWDLGQDEPYI
ncbi:hypothetical protein BDW74DRAFT_147233 [Aspergillus multicolor]|uniref:uncharacterized protein n=1 Tax=Aspergillus multicolor TaxID=41759 RepID=UPI003CCDED90